VAGGALVALLGPLTGVVLNAGCFALGSAIIALVLPRGMGRATRRTRAEPGYWRSFGEGLTFLRGERLLLTIIIMVGITNLLDAALGSVLMPVWARASGNGAAAIGLSGGFLEAAAIVGSLCAAVIAHRMRRRLVFFAGFLLGGTPRFLILASHAPMWAVLTVFAASGFGVGFVNPILGAILFERVPRRMLGRINALSTSLAWAGIPLGGLIAGAVVASFGLVPVLLAGGAAYFLTTALTGLRPEWRQMDRPRGWERLPVESSS
jgi:MFS family permease